MEETILRVPGDVGEKFCRLFSSLLGKCVSDMSFSAAVFSKLFFLCCALQREIGCFVLLIVLSPELSFLLWIRAKKLLQTKKNMNETDYKERSESFCFLEDTNTASHSGERLTEREREREINCIKSFV